MADAEQAEIERSLYALLESDVAMDRESQYRLKRVQGSRSPVYEVFVDEEPSARFVAKLSSRGEITALEAMARLGIEGVPRVVASDASTDPARLIVPSYPGHHGDFSSMPPMAIDTFAEIHARFEDGELQRDFQRLSIDQLFGWAFGDMSIYEPKLEVRMRSIRNAIDVFKAELDQHPGTLVHWDMHPDNVLIDAEDAVIIDWEHACIGPPLIDLTNMIAWSSREFRAYAERFEHYSNRPFDWSAKKREFDWCEAITSIRYMWIPARAGHQARSSEMADVVVRYLEGLH